MRANSKNIVGYIHRQVARQVAHGLQVLEHEYPFTREMLRRTAAQPHGRLGYRVMTPLGRDRALVDSYGTVPSTKNDHVRCLFVCRVVRPEHGDGYWLCSPRYVGAAYILHSTVIAAQHGGALGWATCMGGFDTSTTRNRLSALTGMSFYQSKGTQYCGNMPIDPHRVYVHPSGIAWPMPAYDTPVDWLEARATHDEEFQYA